MKILFLHGWHSVPGGLKPSFLAQHGHEVINPPLDDDDFDQAVRTAQAGDEQYQPYPVAGALEHGMWQSISAAGMPGTWTAVKSLARLR